MFSVWIQSRSVLCVGVNVTLSCRCCVRFVPQSNCWPMILVGGANDFPQDGSGAFQESPQVEFCRPYVKYACRPLR